MSKYAIVLSFLSFSLVAPAWAGTDDAGSPDATAGQTAPTDSATATPAVEGRLSRWLDLDAASFTLRYRNSFDTNGVHIFDDVQQRSLLSGKLKLDKKGNYFIGFRAESGRYFNWSFANISGLDYRDATTAFASHLSLPRLYALLNAYYADPQASSLAAHITARGWEFYMRDFYMSATPVKGLTLEFGSIPIERGVGSEITTFDEDGYIAGERVRVRDPKHLYMDQIEFTSAYLGDVFIPNFFDRYNRLTQSNYRQILAEKHFGSRLKASVDYSWVVGTHTMREAVLAKTNESRALDSVRVELYQRTNDVKLPGYFAKSGNGWAFTGTKQFAKRVTVEGGYATIDQDYGVYSGSPTVASLGFALNADSFQVGQRFFGRANVKILPGVSTFGFFTHQINSKATPLTYSFTRQNLNFGLQLDFKTMLQRAHVI